MQANGASPSQDIELGTHVGRGFQHPARRSDAGCAVHGRDPCPATDRIEQRGVSDLLSVNQAAKLASSRPEAYVQGLYLAQQINDLEGIQWSTVGILQQGWPHEHAEIPKLAKRVADATIEQLKAQHLTNEAKLPGSKRRLDNAQIRDCVVVVSWTGDADIDLLVEEPSGSVCSFRSPRTTGGGVMLGDALFAPRRMRAGIPRRCSSHMFARRASTACTKCCCGACGASPRSTR